MKKLYNILRIVLFSHLGVLAGYSGYAYWHYKVHPGLYAMQSAPWYTGVQMLGMYTAAVACICIGMMIFLHGRIK